MKIKCITIGLAISLMSIRCPDEPVNMSFENKSTKNVVLSSTKDGDSLKKIILKKFSHDFRFKYLKNNSLKNDILGESDLYYYYLRKNQNYYTFYFLKVIKFDTIKDNYVFEKNMTVLMWIKKRF